jgi:peptidoglycan/LPS O-acetylase OafA/YrhL
MMKRLDQLTFTRFFAILLVLIYHDATGPYFKIFDRFPFSALMFSGPVTVCYLYVLSGFVMSLVYHRPAEKFKFLDYWSTRFIRIYPLYILSFLLTCYYYLDGITGVKPQKILTNIFVLQAWWPGYAQSFNYAAWSLTVEFFFYALFPFFTIWAYRQSTKRIIVVSLLIWTFNQVVHYVLWDLYFPQLENFVVYFPVFHLSSFIMGVVGGIWYLRVGQSQTLAPRTIWLTLAGSVSFISIFVIVSSIYPAVFPHGLQLLSGLLAPVLVVATLSLSLDRTRLSDFLSRPIFVNFGEISYAVYIFHVPVIWIYQRAIDSMGFTNPKAVFDYSYLPLIILIGFILHFYIDIPLRKRLKAFMRQISAPLLLLDLAILSASVYFSSRFQFNLPREFNSNYSMVLLMFWSSFILRTIFSAAFKAFDPAILYGSFTQFVRPVLLSVTTGSAVVACIVYTGYSLGWFDGFFRSIFAIDWLIVTALSLLVRYWFRRKGYYSPKPLTA